MSRARGGHSSSHCCKGKKPDSCPLPNVSKGRKALNHREKGIWEEAKPIAAGDRKHEQNTRKTLHLSQNPAGGEGRKTETATSLKPRDVFLKLRLNQSKNAAPTTTTPPGSKELVTASSGIHRGESPARVGGDGGGAVQRGGPHGRGWSRH